MIKMEIDMQRKLLLAAAVAGFAIASSAMSSTAQAANAGDCPNDGTVRFGVEPFEAAPRLIPLFDKIGKLIEAKLGCHVQVFIATSYNAEIEAMRNGKLEVGEFGPLGYVLAHEVAKADAVAGFGGSDGKPSTYWASLATYPGSGIKTVQDIRGHSFAFADPASTSGHLFPAYALRKAGLDPDKDIKGIYAGSHTASFEALYNHKVDAGEFNSNQLESAKQRGHYKDGDLVILWKSNAIPNDPVAVRRDLPEGFKNRLAEVLRNLDLSSLSEADRKIMVGQGITRMVPQTDAAYDEIRDMVHILNIDLTKLSG
jgi:phosphonate transport system substrate-binding protein